MIGKLRRMGRMCPAIVFPAVALVGGPVSPYPTQEEIDRAGEFYTECMRAAAERLDDGHSDILAVGKAVATACETQFNQFIATAEQKLSAKDWQTFEESISGMQVGYGTAAVGQVRAKGRAANQSVEPH